MRGAGPLLAGPRRHTCCRRRPRSLPAPVPAPAPAMAAVAEAGSPERFQELLQQKGGYVRPGAEAREGTPRGRPASAPPRPPAHRLRGGPSAGGTGAQCSALLPRRVAGGGAGCGALSASVATQRRRLSVPPAPSAGFGLLRPAVYEQRGSRALPRGKGRGSFMWELEGPVLFPAPLWGRSLPHASHPACSATPAFPCMCSQTNPWRNLMAEGSGNPFQTHFTLIVLLGFFVFLTFFFNLRFRCHVCGCSAWEGMLLF